MPDTGSSVWTYTVPNNYAPNEDTIRRIVREVLDELGTIPDRASGTMPRANEEG
jgi:hypothetical protein